MKNQRMGIKMENQVWQRIALMGIFCLLATIAGVLFSYLLGGKCSVCKHKDHVVHFYKDTLAISGREIHRYSCCAEYILENYGEPQEIEITHYLLRGKYQESDYSVYMKYPSFTFILSCTDENKDDPSTWDFYGTMITDPSIQFNNGVHIGMSRKQVIWTYRHIGSYHDPGLKLGDRYYESYYDIDFLYDEHDRVTSITFWG